MSTLQNFFFQRNPEKYWNPIDLATSPVLNKTSSAEDLSLEEKLTKLENSVQELKQNCYEIDQSREIFFTRILINNHNSHQIYLVFLQTMYTHFYFYQQ